MPVHLQPFYNYQKVIANDPARFKVLAAGRRAGKSQFALLESADRGINRGQDVWFIAPTYKNLDENWRKFKRLVGHLPTYKNEQQKMMEFAGGGSVAFQSAERYDNLRSMGLDFAVLDEAAFMNPAVWPEVVRPMLMERKGEALFISTPKGRANWFFTLWERGASGEHPNWNSWQHPSTINPLVTKEEVEDARLTMTKERFNQEILALFTESAGGVFHGLDDVCILAGSQPQEDETYAFGVDFGRVNDFTAISILGRENGEQVDLVRFTDIDFQSQLQRIRSLMEKWQPLRAHIESNSFGMPNTETLKAEFPNVVKPFYMTNIKKRLLVDRLAANIEHERIKLLDKNSGVGAVQFGELDAYKRVVTAGGTNITYRAPAGVHSHDDTVVALLLVNQEIRYRHAKTFSRSQNPFYG